MCVHYMTYLIVSNNNYKNIANAVHHGGKLIRWEGGGNAPRYPPPPVATGL